MRLDEWEYKWEYKWESVRLTKVEERCDGVDDHERVPTGRLGERACRLRREQRLHPTLCEDHLGATLEGCCGGCRVWRVSGEHEASGDVGLELALRGEEARSERRPRRTRRHRVRTQEEHRLTPTDRSERVDCEHTGVERCVDRFARLLREGLAKDRDGASCCFGALQWTTQVVSSARPFARRVDRQVGARQQLDAVARRHRRALELRAEVETAALEKDDAFPTRCKRDECTSRHLTPVARLNDDQLVVELYNLPEGLGVDGEADCRTMRCAWSRRHAGPGHARQQPAHGEDRSRHHHMRDEGALARSGPPREAGGSSHINWNSRCA